MPESVQRACNPPATGSAERFAGGYRIARGEPSLNVEKMAAANAGSDQRAPAHAVCTRPMAAGVGRLWAHMADLRQVSLQCAGPASATQYANAVKTIRLISREKGLSIDGMSFALQLKIVCSARRRHRNAQRR